MIHHSLTKDSETVSWGAIRRYHVDHLHWRDIGYHFGVELVYDDFEILVGRTLDESGAHCYQEGMNRKAIGICLVGNFDKVEPPDQQIRATVKLVRSLMRQFNIPVHNVVAHRDYAHYKSCPGVLFYMEKFKARLR